ncbi:isoaspartyl peptidase/L-asparaginase family protein [Mariniblastus fucicola]|uniref:Isoaspartyl peptidase n=1 Tax=Mariniblastus fucicola TaxID=980251 RepID=A0A5B9PA66_9BACT|nr:isoaspartyl peptidase/L-asparaginase [Mariniblastus fucicola]QEG23677.1 Isoaspartyl peptidase precursor [Mariniblastus fucicola]
MMTRTLAAAFLILGLFACNVHGQEPAKTANHEPTEQWAIAIHGGAGSLDRDMPEEKKAAFKKALANALNVGKKILAEGGTSLDAVQATVIELENCELFNAGRGAVFNRVGMHELDASIMDGSTLKCGAVAMVKNTRSPISAARLVMENTPHVLLCGPEADQFAKENGCEMVHQHHFYTPRRFAMLNKKRIKIGLKPLDTPGYELPESGASSSSASSNGHDDGSLNAEASESLQTRESGGSTVGCVALDQHGNLAAATSTGGLTAKLGGRVGDSPIIGAGTYANDTVAVSGTGIGEQYIRHSIAARVAMLMEIGNLEIDSALEHCLTKVLDPEDGGLIAVDRSGKISLQSSTDSMARGAADSSGRFETKLWMDED